MSARRAALLCGAGLSLLLATAAWSGNGRIGLFFDPGGQKCADAIPCTGFGQLYVYAMLEGASRDGITGAEYSIQIGPDAHSDPGWVFHEEFPEDAVALGKAFFPLDIDTHQFPYNPGRGVNIAFPTCQRGEGQMVLLETATVANNSCSTAPLPLLVVLHDNPSNGYFACLLFTLCDSPTYTKLCLGRSSGQAVINPGPGQTAPCPGVAVTPVTWSAVKEMFRR